MDFCSCGGNCIVGLGHGNTPTWLNQTDSGRTFTSLNRVVQSGLVLNLDAGASTSYPGSGTTWGDIGGGLLSSATGALPIYNTTDTYGAVKGDGTRTDAFASSLVLAIPIDGANNGTTFTDESATIKGSGSAKTITRFGDTKTLTAQSKFYGSSGFFDGTGDYLSIPDDVDFDLGSSNFTIEGFVYVTATSGSLQTLIAKGTGNNNQASYHIALTTGGTWVYYLSGNGSTWSIASAITIGTNALNTWQHIALVRNGSTFTPYLNGVAGTPTTSSTALFDSNKIFSVGADDPGNQLLFGYIQDLRIYKGVAKYTANFTPPGNPNNGTLTNGPTYSSGNGGSIVLDGADDFVNTPNSASLLAVGNGSFTFASWFKLSGTKTWAQNLIRRDNFLVQGGENRRIIAMNITANTNFVSFGIYDGGGNNAITSQNLSDGLWHYVVGVRESSTGTNYVYVDGVLKAQAVYNNTQPFNTSNASYAIGNVSSNYTGEPFFGNIAQVSIYNRALSAAEVIQNYNALKGRFPTPPTPEYETLTYTASGNLTVTGNGTNTVNIFKTSGGNAWDNQAYSLVPFTAPCTIEFNKQAASGDNGASYAMIGWNADPLTNASYDTLDYASYPYRTDVYSVYHNSTQVHFSGSWSTANKFYVVYGTDGTIKHYNGYTLLYSVNYGTGNTVYVDSSFYSPNATFGGFSNIKVRRSAWNGTSYG